MDSEGVVNSDDANLIVRALPRVVPRAHAIQAETIVLVVVDGDRLWEVSTLDERVLLDVCLNI